MYGKLFTQMYDGTLATKGPWESLVTFQQLIILADKNGCVDMTAEAIARRTTIPLEIIELGLSKLVETDIRSRSDAEEGRRIVPIDPNRDWGWRIVNYAFYRKIRSEEERREYHRLYARKRRESTTESTDVNTSTPSQLNQPIAVSSKQEAIKSKIKSGARGSRLPEGWRPTEEQKRWAEARRPDVDVTLEAETFANFWSAAAGRGAVKMNWEAAWRNWIVKSKPTSAVNGHSKTFTKLSRLQRLKDEYGSADCDALPATGVPRLGGDSGG